MNYTFKTLDECTITEEFRSAYNRLLFQLKGRECNVTADELQNVQQRKDSELLLCMYNEQGELAGTAQASFICTPTSYTAYINTVVVDEKYRGQGLGKLLMEELHTRVKNRWPSVLKCTLTSSPQKGTQGFYLKLGYHMRTKEEGDETIVYVKDMQ
jgi:GNAT superfamily N-acetyltransferase